MWTYSQICISRDYFESKKPFRWLRMCEWRLNGWFCISMLKTVSLLWLFPLKGVFSNLSVKHPNILLKPSNDWIPTNATWTLIFFDPEAFGNVFKTRIQYETSNAPNAKSEGETMSWHYSILGNSILLKCHPTSALRTSVIQTDLILHGKTILELITAHLYGSHLVCSLFWEGQGFCLKYQNMVAWLFL